MRCHARFRRISVSDQHDCQCQLRHMCLGHISAGPPHLTEKQQPANVWPIFTSTLLSLGIKTTSSVESRRKQGHSQKEMIIIRVREPPGYTHSCQRQWQPCLGQFSGFWKWVDANKVTVLKRLWDRANGKAQTGISGGRVLGLPFGWLHCHFQVSTLASLLFGSGSRVSCMIFPSPDCLIY